MNISVVKSLHAKKRKKKGVEIVLTETVQFFNNHCILLHFGFF